MRTAYSICTAQTQSHAQMPNEAIFMLRCILLIVWRISYILQFVFECVLK